MGKKTKKQQANTSPVANSETNDSLEKTSPQEFCFFKDTPISPCGKVKCHSDHHKTHADDEAPHSPVNKTHADDEAPHSPVSEVLHTVVAEKASSDNESVIKGDDNTNDVKAATEKEIPAVLEIKSVDSTLNNTSLDSHVLGDSPVIEVSTVVAEKASSEEFSFESLIDWVDKNTKTNDSESADFLKMVWSEYFFSEVWKKFDISFSDSTGSGMKDKPLSSGGNVYEKELIAFNEKWTEYKKAHAKEFQNLVNDTAYNMFKGDHFNRFRAIAERFNFLPKNSSQEKINERLEEINRHHNYLTPYIRIIDIVKTIESQDQIDFVVDQNKYLHQNMVTLMFMNYATAKNVQTSFMDNMQIRSYVNRFANVLALSLEAQLSAELEDEQKDTHPLTPKLAWISEGMGVTAYFHKKELDCIESVNYDHTYSGAIEAVKEFDQINVTRNDVDGLVVFQRHEQLFGLSTKPLNLEVARREILDQSLPKKNQNTALVEMSFPYLVEPAPSKNSLVKRGGVLIVSGVKGVGYLAGLVLRALAAVLFFVWNKMPSMTRKSGSTFDRNNPLLVDNNSYGSNAQPSPAFPKNTAQVGHSQPVTFTNTNTNNNSGLSSPRSRANYNN
ncbi:MAG: hypothetical protein FJ161_02730 [Gammaproteobacteria bacterium]|nr:hypothetical protein [Gammaproteobacteria bacterium]